MSVKVEVMLYRYGRKVIAAPPSFRRAYVSVVTERDVLRRDLAECRESLRELKAAVEARWQAEARLADLYREHAIQRALAAQRDPCNWLELN